ncbi:phosphorylase b kinase gamma catalytic chain, skeletal muscle/heart isoform isoform X1 [Glossina fuscipes]|uniref:phosphorylase kinase n=1 Tax=Glossina fuscipes TaxID=7396 RepID=A0A8U0WM21_9MUSC|nr:phosphorylase b kinase gamma catalytic chain, skeletal muscle/heart isoform isoform X1 [Glossina fuscipes]XP_037886175.1 phosphorylase b kinase gamma catalytic chain, skeletal muscle/heart isoform isoform X1 [Glossina fuscipes]
MAKDEEDDLLPDKDAAKGFYAKYEPKEILGRGISSTVRRCIEKETGKEFAAKIIDLGAATETGETNPLHMLEATRQEISILRQVMGHPYIIDLQDVFESDAFVFLVFELCPKGELFDYLTSVVTLSEKKTRTIMRQIFEGVEYIHSKNIVHRDLKPENILLDGNHNVKITDFGFARQLKDGEKLTDLCGTPGYLAPETLKCNMFEGSPGYSQEVDIWACGVIMFTLLVGCPPFWHRKQMVMLRNIMEGKYSFTSPEWADISEDPKDLIRKCLVVDPIKRITVQEVLRHPFFNQMVLLPEPSIDGRTTTYHLCEQNIRTLREYSKFYETTHENSQLMEKSSLKQIMETTKHLPTDTDINIESQRTTFQQSKANAIKCGIVDCDNFLVPTYPATSAHFRATQQQHEQQRLQNIRQHQLYQHEAQQRQTTIHLHNYTANLKRGLFYTQQLRKQSCFNARKKFQFVILVVRAVVRIKRLRYTAEPLHVDEAIRDPYRIKVLRKVIDGCAFRVYGHWVKKGEGQNRAALFENTPRTELHALYINNLSR